MNTAIRLLISGCVCVFALFPSGTQAQCGMTVSIQASPPPPYNLCPGETILLTSSVTGGVGPYEYEWFGPWPGVLTTQNISLTPPYQGAIQLFVTDANGCIEAGFIHIKAWVSTVEIVFNPFPICQGDSLLLSAWPDFPNGTTFIWSTGQTTQNIDVFSSGTYSVTMTNPNGCTSMAEITVGIFPEPTPAPVITGPVMLCEGQDATLTLEGGPFAWHYWNNFTTSSTLDIDGPGIYWVEVANATGCVGLDSFIVESGGLPPVLEGPSALCAGQQDTISVTNANDYESFDWSTGSNNSSITISNTGTYTVTVTASGGCTATGSVIVTSVNSNINLSGLVTTVTSCASPNGAINLTVSPSGGYTFLWSNGATTEDIANVLSGSYSVTVTDAGGCTSGTTFNIPLNITTPFVLSSVTPASCDQSDGSINLIVTPPAGTYTFIWSNGATTEDLTNISPGTYDVTVTLVSNGCTSIASATVTNTTIDLSVAGNITQPSDGQNNGAINITTSPPGTYAYNWSNGATAEDITGLGPGTYAVTVSVGNCTEIAVFTLTEMVPCPGFNAFIAEPIGNVFCVGDALTLTTFTIGGTAPFSYLWSTGGTGSTETIILTGAIDVTLTVTDANGCTSTSSQHIKPMLWWAEGNIVGDSVCIGQSVTLESSFNTWTSHVWSTGETTPSIQVTTPGTYTVTITDDPSECTFVLELTPTFLSGLTVAITGPDATCPGQLVTLNTTGGPFNTYIWSPGGQNTPGITVNNAGTYSVTVSNGTGCDGFDEHVITEGNADPPILSGTANICDGQNSVIEITNSGSYASLLWSTGETSSSITVGTPGTYAVTVTSVDGCVAQGSFVVSHDPNAPTIANNINAATCSEDNGNIDLTISPTGTYTFQWSNGSNDEDQFNLPAGIYAVTVTSVNGCTSTTSINIPDIPVDIVIAGIATPNTSCVSANGAINITVNPFGAYSFEWSNGESTEDLNDIPSGSYTVTVTLGLTCVETQSFIVDDNPGVPGLTGSITQNTSCAQPNGAIDISMNPSGAYTFVWSNGETSEDLQQLAAGIYSVTATNNEGCSISDFFQITNTSSSFELAGEATPNTSCVSANGVIDISVSPVGVYLYDWSNGASTEDLQNLSPGMYIVTVTDMNNCSVVDLFSIIDSLIYPMVSGLITPASCGESNGAIDISVSPANNTYAWSNGSNTEDQFNLVSGDYILTVTGANACFTLDTFMITDQSSDFVLTSTSTPNNSCQDPNGAIDLNISPPGSYAVIWSTGATTEDLAGISAGAYIVTVTDNFNCVSSSVVLVDDNSSNPILSATVTPATCGAGNGAIDLTVIPAAGNAFLWSNGGMSEDLQNLLPGSYSVIVTDEQGCQSMDTFDIQNINSNFSIAGAPTANTSCVSPNGSIDITVSPTGSYSFVWSNASISEDLQSISAGTYMVTVTDSLNCMSTSVFIIEDNAITPILTAAITPALCGGGNGAIDLTVNPAAGNAFLWSNGGMSEDLQGLLPGSYHVIVTDAQGCQSMDTFDIQNINSNFSISVLPVANTSCADSNGSIDLTILPAGAYSFVWSNGSTTEDIFDLAPGTYTVTVTDLLSCSSTATGFIGNHVPGITILTATAPATCGIDNGSISVTVDPPAIGFSWSNGDTTGSLQNLAPGTYVVTITDMNGCEIMDSFVVSNIGAALSISAVPIANTHCTTHNGALDISVSPAGVYTFIWSNGSMAEDQTNLPPGMYVLTVSDVNGCSSTGSFVVQDQTIRPLLTTTISPATCGETNGQVDLAVSPSGDYLIAWSNGALSEDLADIPAGTYSVTVTSENGCTTNAIVIVPDETTQFSISATTTHNTSCTGGNGGVDLTVLPAGGYDFLWSNGAMSEDLQFLQPGVYTVTVTDNSNCAISESFTIDNAVVDLIVTGTIAPMFCGEPNGSIDISVVPPSGNGYLWSNGTTDEDLATVSSGTYTVTITGQNGCTASSAFAVPENQNVEVEIEADGVDAGDIFVTIRAHVNLPMSALDTIIWLPGNLFNCTQDICLEQTIEKPSQQTEIIVMVIDTHGCMAQASLMMDAEINPNVYIPNVFSPNGDGQNDLFTVYGNEDVEEITELRIFDRWGTFVFINTHFPPNEASYGWDGSFKNSEMQPAVFVYWAKVKFVDGSEDFYKGDVTLFR